MELMLGSVIPKLIDFFGIDHNCDDKSVYVIRINLIILNSLIDSY